MKLDIKCVGYGYVALILMIINSTYGIALSARVTSCVNISNAIQDSYLLINVTDYSCRCKANYYWVQAAHLCRYGTLYNCLHDQRGYFYTGNVSVTRSGHVCQRWDKNVPRYQPWPATYFPDQLISHNNCRNPSNDSMGPWCYSADTQIVYDYCSIPKCKDVLAPASACKRSMLGTEYTGTVALTLSNLTCQRWDKQTPHAHGYTNSFMYPDSLVSDASNYCRNPNNNSGGPWCFTTSSSPSWQYCKVPLCQDFCSVTAPCTNVRNAIGGSCHLVGTSDYACKCDTNYYWVQADHQCHYGVLYNCLHDVTGYFYTGNVSMTSSGHVCQRWDQQVPHRQPWYSTYFPDQLINHNYCRNPSNDSNGPWCYSADSQIVYGSCSIPKCSNLLAPRSSCRRTAIGSEYSGQISTTVSNLTCQRWDTQSPNSHRFTNPFLFPDSTLTQASNYCRNPNNDTGGPWCYTLEKGKWEHCAIPLCSGFCNNGGPCASIANANASGCQLVGNVDYKCACAPNFTWLNATKQCQYDPCSNGGPCTTRIVNDCLKTATNINGQCSCTQLYTWGATKGNCVNVDCALQETNSTYNALRAKLIAPGSPLHYDCNWPATDVHLWPTSSVQVAWMRPKDIINRTAFLNLNLTRAVFLDQTETGLNIGLSQGYLGDCATVSSVSIVAASGILLELSTPIDQSFEKDYTGLFHFNLWNIDQWQEVLVDDWLPVSTSTGRPLFLANDRNPSEFWAPLLEKAYAKFKGGYNAIKGGVPSDTLKALTGCLDEDYNLAKPPSSLFDYILQARTMQSLIVSWTAGDPTVLTNVGLVNGHAYAIIDATEITVGNQSIQLVRLQNPWDTQEFTGSWSPSSPEWMNLTDQQRVELSVENLNYGTAGNIYSSNNGQHGHFWMSYVDLLKYFYYISLCHLNPEALNGKIQDAEKSVWNNVTFQGSWKNGTSAGGILNSKNPDLFWTNPRFVVTLNSAEDYTVDGLIDIIIDLTQKSQLNYAIAFYVYQIPTLPSQGSSALPPQPKSFQPIYSPSSMDYLVQKTVASRIRVAPGTYVIIPTTLQPMQEADFVLQIFTERPLAIINAQLNYDEMLA